MNPPTSRSQHPAHRGSIACEQARVLEQQAHPGEQYILRVEAPDCARRAQPGQFAHLGCDPLLPLRRPLSILRARPKQGQVEFLYKAVGQGTRLLAQRRAGDVIRLLGPIGRPFSPAPTHPRALLLGGGVGMPPMVFLAEHLKARPGFEPLVLLASEVPFPFRVAPSKILLPDMPEGVIGAMPLLDDWGIPSRLASLQGFAGCHQGYITDLARHWLDRLDARTRGEVALYACGPHPMLAAVAALAREYGLPCQVSLEEYMACAVGGCAGCVVEVHSEEGTAMKRVCVDGPVFDAAQVF
ncbi:MAG TPA: dihydroorotate dehydrogenase electron transfer subunit [Gammaproteobacteria bacterium]|nr:dihydroorotate dehydrogenase electron transfer subunit [Gammaproteobacteria bacterium]